jgi:hypothetical protein
MALRTSAQIIVNGLERLETIILRKANSSIRKTDQPGLRNS